MNAPPILFLVLPKREWAAPGPREKNASAGRSARSAYLRPPARDGWPFRVSDWMKRDTLGETSGPGRARIPPTSLSAGAASAFCWASRRRWLGGKNAGRRGRRPLRDGMRGKSTCPSGLQAPVTPAGADALIRPPCQVFIHHQAERKRI